jgi:hypothetical protein
MKVLPSRVLNRDYCFVNNSFGSSIGTNRNGCSNRTPFSRDLRNVLSIAVSRPFFSEENFSPPFESGGGERNS